MSSEECVVILAGGEGSRLRPHTTVLPKPLIPVGDVPICEVVLHQIREAGFRRVIMAVSRHDRLLRSYFGDGSGLGMEIEYSREPSPLGTCAPLHLMEDRLPENFVVMNGDLLTDLDYRAFLNAHVGSRCQLTISTYCRSLRIGDGVIEIGDDGRVTAFQEKPVLHRWISMGIYGMKRSILEFIPKNAKCGMDQLVLGMLAKKEPVMTHRHEGQWYDIGSPTDLEQARIAFATNRMRFLGAADWDASEPSTEPALTPG